MRITAVLVIVVGSLMLLVGSNAPVSTQTAPPQEQAGHKPPDVVKLALEHKLGPVTFSHTNHTTKNYSVDGTKPIGCVECHHTDQPAAEAAKHPPLKTAHPADRTVTLTAETAKDPKTPKVESCRACHAQEGDKPKIGDAIPEVTYEGDTDPTVLTNEEAYHRNCNGCHDQATDLRKIKTAPTNNECAKCHTGK